MNPLRPILIWLCLAAVAIGADDTAALQTMLDRPGDFGVVVFPPGEHETGPLYVGPKVRWLFEHPQYPTTLKLKANAGDGARVLNVIRTSDVDTEVYIGGLSIDLNRSEQGQFTGNQIEHQAGVFVESKGTGRVKCTMQGLVIFNSGGAGVYQYHYTDVDASGLTISDTFRGGFNVTGHRSTTLLEDSTFIKAGIDVEPNAAGGHYVDVTMRRIKCFTFDIALTKDSKCVAEHIEHTGGAFVTFCHPQAKLRVADSTFIGWQKCRLPGQSTFERCVWTGFPNGKQVIGIAWQNKTPNDTKDQKFELIDCIINGPGTVGIDTGQDRPANQNWLVLRGTSINGTTKGVAVGTNNGSKGNWLFENSSHNGVPLQ